MREADYLQAVAVASGAAKRYLSAVAHRENPRDRPSKRLRCSSTSEHVSTANVSAALLFRAAARHVSRAASLSLTASTTTTLPNARFDSAMVRTAS